MSTTIIKIKETEYSIPSINGTLDLSGYAESLKFQLQQSFSNGDYYTVFDSDNLIDKDWEGLKTSCLSGNLNPLYNRLVMAGFVHPATATTEQIANASNITFAALKLDTAIATIKDEGAVAACIYLLLSKSDFVFTEEEKRYGIQNPQSMDLAK